jgi:hypothetical protein
MAMRSHKPVRDTRKLCLVALVLGASLLPVAQAAGPWRADASNTRGWQFMTPQERVEHQARIRAFDDYQACRTYQIEHHRTMQERARQQGRTLGPEQRDFCAHLQPAPGTR